MAENQFLGSNLTDNGFQDPMGHDAHQGLERFLAKFHQPGVPGHTIITDPEYHVSLWFHNAIGNLIYCPYIRGGYIPKLKSNNVNFDAANARFGDPYGIQSGESNDIQEKCLDLTPFVREAQLPEIAPANGEKIQTLFGETTAGSFSPYASDGSKSITLQMIDTEYSILDAIFYPWMKDINSPWWYRPDKAYSEWATPYPMATLEVQRPRMRYSNSPKAGESRKDGDYTYYSYRFIGIKPVSYSAFEANGSGRTNPLRTLNLISDMCIVDLTHDMKITESQSINLGNDRRFIFDEDDQPADSSDGPVDEQTKDDEFEADLEQAAQDFFAAQKEDSANNNDIGQQENDDQPGEDIPETNPDSSPNDIDQSTSEQDIDAALNEAELSMSSNRSISSVEFDETTSLNRYLNFLDIVANDGLAKFHSESDDILFSQVMDTMFDIGKSILDDSSTKFGWVANGDDFCLGIDKDLTQYAMGIAIDILRPTDDMVTKDGDQTIQIATKVVQDAIGPAVNLASTAVSSALQLGGDDAAISAITASGVDIGLTSTSVGIALGSSGDEVNSFIGRLDKQFDGSGIPTIWQCNNISSETSSQYESSRRFRLLGDALCGVEDNGSIVFGVVSDTQSSAYGLSGIYSAISSGQVKFTNSASTTIGGILNRGLQQAFPYLCLTIGRAANYLGYSLSIIGQSSYEVGDMISFFELTTDSIRSMLLVTSDLTKAAQSIVDGIYDLEELAISIQDTKNKNVTSQDALGSLGSLISRISTGYCNMPTPIEGYVGMVTKNYTAGTSKL